jgi:hypothetical protein
VTRVTRRRGAFGLLAAGAFGRAAPAVANPDAEIIRLCAAFSALEVRVKAAFYGPDAIRNDDDRDAVLDPIREEQEDLLLRITALRATTLRGIVARAAMYVFWDEGFPEDWEGTGTWDQMMLLALVRDASGVSHDR